MAQRSLDLALAREAPYALLVHLVSITLKGATPITLNFSDRSITVAGVRYDDYVLGMDAFVESCAMAARYAAAAAVVSPRISWMLPRNTDIPDELGKSPAL